MSDQFIPDEWAAQVVKIGARVPISAELLRDMTEPPPEVTDEDRARWERARAEVEAWKIALHTALDATEGIVRQIADLHHEEDGKCDGCEDIGYESERPYWPCSTSVLIGRHLGVEPPEHWTSW